MTLSTVGIDTQTGLEYQSTVLPNGLRVISAPMPYTRSASVQFFLGVGARHERPEVSGISHFVEHMVFKGTHRRPNPAQISEAIEGVGGNLNAATDHEHTNYRVLVPYTYMGTAMEVVTDMLRGSRFDNDEIVKEREVIIEEISSTYDSPPDICDLVFDEMLWGTHPLGRDVAGSRQSVRRIKRKDLVAHVDEHYRPEALVISVAGRVSHAEVVDHALRLWGDLTPGNNGATPDSPSPDESGGPRIMAYRKRTEQTNVIVGVPALPYTHPRRFTQDVLDAILGCGMSSRLFVELRENRGLAYSVSSFVKTYSDTGAFGVHAAVDNGDLSPVLEGIMGELKRVRDEPVPAAELRKVKEYIKGNTMLSMERSGYVAHWAGWHELMLGRIDSPEDVLDKIEQVTTEDIQQLAADLFQTSKLHMAVVGPVKDESKFSGLLKVG
jgi:predicted Zn-dependent peptidase